MSDPAEQRRIVVFDDYRVGVLLGSEVLEITDLIEGWTPTPQGVLEFVEQWPRLRARLGGDPDGGRRRALADVRLQAPVPVPRNVLAAPVNYREHRGEIEMDRSGEADSAATARERGFFLKSPASIVGPQDRIELPALPGREFHFEGEIAFVVGRAARAVPREQAWDHVLGLTGLIDVTLRPSADRVEERSMRKSFYSFCPLGPCLLITDEPPDPAEVGLELRLNGEIRQQASLADLVVDIPELLEIGSATFPLSPGDVFASGTPSGVGPIRPGDELTLVVTPVGEMTLPVVERGW